MAGWGSDHGIDVDPAHQHICFVEQSLGPNNNPNNVLVSVIRRMNYDGSGVIDLLPLPQFTVTGLSLNLVNGQVYWAERTTGTANSGRIMRADLNGADVMSVLTGWTCRSIWKWNHW